MYYKRPKLFESLGYLRSKFPVVAIVGARQVGKSTLLQTLADGKRCYDLEDRRDFDRVSADPFLFFREQAAPYFFDEAQRCPELFNAIRIEVDKRRHKNGQFILTGSSSPELLSQLSQTLAGRIAIIEVGPFDWSDATQTAPSQFCRSLSDVDAILSLRPIHDHRTLLELCLVGGYPDPYIQRDDPKYRELWFENYFKTYVERDIRALFPRLNLQAYRRFIQMIAFATGEILNASNFARSLDVSQPTVKNYMSILEGTFIWRRLPSYQKSKAKRVVKMPRGHLRDTGLANFLLNIHTTHHLKGHPAYGRIWESFVIEQILKSCQASLVRCDATFFRTNNASEIDLIMEGNFGTIPIEIKAGTSADRRKLGTLERFVRDQNCPFGIVVNNGDEVFRLSEHLIQVPAAFL